MVLDNDLKKIIDNRTKILGFAALCILFFHTWMFVFDDNTNLGVIETFIKTISFFGVDIFILLSGMGLVDSIKKGIKKFYYNRIKRITFTYILTSCFAFFIYNWTILKFIKNVFFYNFFTKSIYSYLWFVPAILIFYLLFPIYYKLFEKAKNKNIFIILSICIWFILAFLLKGHIRNEIYGIINRIPIFITGIWLRYFIDKKEFKFHKLFLLINITVLIIGLQLSYLTNFKGLYILLPVSNCLANYLIALPITIILAYLFNICSIKSISKFFEFYGTISFQLYCIQEMFYKFTYMIILKFNLLSVPHILINILFFIFITFLAKRILFLEKLFWHKIENK